MTTPARLLIVGAIALLVSSASPSASPSSGRKHVVLNTEGDVLVELYSDIVDATGYVPIDRSRIELVQGRSDPIKGQEIMLTKFLVQLRPFVLPKTSKGPLYFNDVTIGTRGALTWWGRRIAGRPGTMGTYAIEIPPDPNGPYFGDPTFVAASKVTEKTRMLFLERDRVVKPITGIIDFDGGTFEIFFELEASVAAPWWAPWSDGLSRRFTARVKGEITTNADLGFERAPDEGRMKHVVIPPAR